jgi:hypothetical protein
MRRCKNQELKYLFYIYVKCIVLLLFYVRDVELTIFSFYIYGGVTGKKPYLQLFEIHFAFVCVIVLKCDVMPPQLHHYPPLSKITETGH